MDPGRLSNEMKFQVMDQNNQPLGQVEDMVLNLQTLKVAYVIVSLSQSSSTSQTVVAVPWEMLQVQTQASGQSSGQGQAGTTPTTTLQTSNPQGQGAFIFQGDAQQLSGAPAFSRDMLPPLGQPASDWDSAIRSYWGESGTSASGSTTEMPTVAATQVTTPTTGSSTTTPGLHGVILASKVIGYSIGTNNQPIASVEDVIVDVNSGDLKYVVLSLSNRKVD
jgi:sporulation protein YlmC with PRC-barrel domain